LVSVSHRISDGIVETALAEECNLIVLGRARRTSSLERLVATLVDRVVRSSPAQVIEIGAESWPAKLNTVLLAFEAGPNSELTVEIGHAFAATASASLRVVHVVAPEATEAQIDAARREVGTAVGRVGAPEEIRIVRSSQIVSGVLRESRGADLIVLGGTEAGLLEHLLGYALPLELADRTVRPVAIVYEMPADPKRWLA
jgi:nucleotide-binding universal stress UspA family protein